jgi:uncharacterized protein YceK
MLFMSKVVIVLSVLFLTSGCSTNPEPEIDPTTGMAVSLCPVFKDSYEQANKEIWALAEMKTSVESAQKTVLNLMADASTISVVSNEPASLWLESIQENGKYFLSWFGMSNSSDSQELIQIYGQWKVNYESLETYCP